MKIRDPADKESSKLGSACLISLLARRLGQAAIALVQGLLAPPSHVFRSRGTARSQLSMLCQKPGIMLSAQHGLSSARGPKDQHVEVLLDMQGNAVDVHDAVVEGLRRHSRY